MYADDGHDRGDGTEAEQELGHDIAITKPGHRHIPPSEWT
jgi:hypothetical protein